MRFYVTKADGSKQLFDREKVAGTCMRMGASSHTAFEVAMKVEQRIYDGISTDKILEMIFRFMRKYKPGVKHLFDLRKGLSLMSSKPEFEMFVQTVLAHNGFEVGPNQILNGKCVEHEVDGIASKDGITYFVEAKHHFLYHTLTGLDESRIARAILEDVTEGFILGKNNTKINRAMIVTNTRFSEQARRYGKCKKILQIGWSSPENLALQNMIESKKLYPLSCLKWLKDETRTKLVNSGIVLIKQLLEKEPAKLVQEVMLPQQTLREIVEKVGSSINGLWNS